MAKFTNATNVLRYGSVELGGVSYAIVPATVLAAVCRLARLEAVPRGVAGGAVPESAVTR